MKLLLMSFVLLSNLMAFDFFYKDNFSDVPKPKIVQMTNYYLILPKNIKIIKDNAFYLKYKASFNSFEKVLKRYKENSTKKISIVFSKIKDMSRINEKYRRYLVKNESYMLIIGLDTIQIKSIDEQGLLNGLSTLESLIVEHNGKLSRGWIIDYPDLKMRVLHISMWPCTIEDFKKTIRLARLEHFNTLIWLNHFGVKLKSLKHLKINNKNRWSIEQFKKMVSFVKQNGLEIIPELKLLSHQKKFMGAFYPQYMYNKATYDPRKKELYKKVVFPAIDELIELTGASKFCIGHDEVLSYSKYHYKQGKLNPNDKQLPPNLFLDDVLILYNYLKKRNIETWMWGDMLISKKQFPSMKNSHGLNGSKGYTALRSKIPKDIVICDWHYNGKQKSFPTSLVFALEGHKVLGATWKDKETIINFTKYINTLSVNAEGMIATTWYGLSGKEKKTVQRTIKFSGEAFWNAK